MKKIYFIIITALFLLVLFVTPIILLVTKDETFSENENRYLAQKPSVSFEAVLSGEFMRDTEKYIDDQFPTRDFFISVKSNLLQLLGSKDINGVYLGKDKYLIEKWLKSDFDEQLLQRNTNIVNSFLEQHQNQKTSIIVVPTAGLVLKDKLPQNAPVFDQNKAFEMIVNGINNSDILDLRNTLLSHNQEYVFYKTDHHWTSYGAFLGYLEWCKKNGISIQINDFDVNVITDSFKGSLYSKVLSSTCATDKIEIYNRRTSVDYEVYYNFGKRQSNSVYAMENLEKKDKYQVFLNGNHPEVTITTSNANGKHLMVFKDSFANAFIPFLINDYESIHVIDLRYFNYDVETYIAENDITDFMFLYNIRNFCEDKNMEKLSNY